MMYPRSNKQTVKRPRTSSPSPSALSKQSIPVSQPVSEEDETKSKVNGAIRPKRGVLARNQRDKETKEPEEQQEEEEEIEQPEPVTRRKSRSEKKRGDGELKPLNKNLCVYLKNADSHGEQNPITKVKRHRQNLPHQRQPPHPANLTYRNQLQGLQFPSQSQQHHHLLHVNRRESPAVLLLVGEVDWGAINIHEIETLTEMAPTRQIRRMEAISAIMGEDHPVSAGPMEHRPMEQNPTKEENLVT